MSTNIYMKIECEDGKWLKGSSTAKGHEEEIEVVAWSHGFSQPTTAATKSVDQQATSRANHMDFSFTKFFDKASDDLCQACWTGQQLKKIEIRSYRASGSSDVGSGATEYLKVVMENVIVSSYSISGGGDELPIENLTLNYTIVSYSYLPVVFETGKTGDAAHIAHNLATNEVGGE